MSIPQDVLPTHVFFHPLSDTPLLLRVDVLCTVPKEVMSIASQLSLGYLFALLSI